MRGGRKLSLVALTALLVVVGLAACGGGSSSSTAEGAASAPAEAGSTEGASKQGGAGGGAGKGEQGSGGEGSSGGKGGSASEGKEASEFVPKQHSDSGGGSARFRTKGGDNSVQEFGEEAGESEFDEAATVVHDFLDARAEGNWAAACVYVSKTIIGSIEKLAAKSKRLGDEGCAGILVKLVNPEAQQAIKTEAAKADIRSLRSEGERGFVLYTVGGAVYSMPLIREGGEWKVGSLSAYPLSG